VIIPIERRGARPVFRQIVDYLKRAIEAGRLAPGTKLEPIRVLARELGVNRETVADAYRELEALGLTESTVGRGTFVLARMAVNGAAVASRAESERGERPFVPLLSRAVEATAALPGLDYSAEPRAVRFERLVPDPSLYPLHEFRRALNRVLLRDGRLLLDYGDPRGHAGLRRILVERLARSGVEASADDLVITGGSTQGLAIVARLFCDPGDAVAVESPTYPGSGATFVAAGLRLAPVPLRRDGLDLDVLDALLARGGTRLVYTMPSFQNPTGLTTSLEHRRRLLEIAARHGVAVLEDDFENELRVRGRPVPPLKALDRTGNVVYAGTFSKALFPGARIGWIVASAKVLDGALVLKRALDLASSPVLQAGLAQLCRSGDYDRHVRRVAKEVARRLACAESAIETWLPAGTTVAHAEGGFILWVTLPEGIDTLATFRAAKAAGVVYAPGQLFYPDGRRSSELRLSVAQVGVDDIERGIRILGEVTHAALPRRRTTRGAREAPRVHV
jgi:DNA-binding transcriptional MocR family regulator